MSANGQEAEAYSNKKKKKNYRFTWLTRVDELARD